MVDAHTDPLICSIDVCRGSVIEQGRCLAHCTSAEMQRALATSGGDAPDVDLRGCIVTASAFAHLRDALPEDGSGRPFVGDFDCSGAALDGEQFKFTDMRFRGRCDFTRTKIEGWALFGGARFSQRPDFAETVFAQLATFRGAQFTVGANFSSASFEGLATFRGADAESGSLLLISTRFARRSLIGPLDVAGDVRLDSAVCDQRVTIDIAAQRVVLAGASFQAGVHIEIRRGDLVLDQCTFAQASTCTGRGKARLISLRGADVAGLSLDSIDLRACRFLGAHRLNELRLGGMAELPMAARGLRWARRQTIAEEHDYRAGSADWYPPACQPPEWLSDGDLDLVDPPQRSKPEEVELLYRSLRKAKEDSGDAPGAGDFYYGEMEMRRYRLMRHGYVSRAGLERLLVSIYWLISGYGLRATRSGSAFMVVVILSTAALAIGGFRAPVTELRAMKVPNTQSVRFVVEDRHERKAADAFFGALSAAVPGFNRALPPRTFGGDLTLLLGHLFGPALLGLAVFSLRGQLRR